MEKQTLKHSKSAIATLGKLQKKFGENKCLLHLDEMIENESIDFDTARKIHSMFKQMEYLYECIEFKHTIQNKHAKIIAKLIKDDLMHRVWTYNLPTNVLSYVFNYINAYYKEIISIKPIKINT